MITQVCVNVKKPKKMKLSKLKEIIRENIKELKERQYGKGTKKTRDCFCCDTCGGSIGSGAPYSYSCGDLCAEMCAPHCGGGGMASGPSKKVHIRIG